MAMTQPTGYEQRVVDLLGGLAELLLKKNEEKQPFVDYPDLLHAADIEKITGWSESHIYNLMKRPDFRLANGGERPYCIFKRDFIKFLERETP